MPTGAAGEMVMELYVGYTRGRPLHLSTIVTTRPYVRSFRPSHGADTCRDEGVASIAPDHPDGGSTIVPARLYGR
jgi:hypothetical protein